MLPQNNVRSIWKKHVCRKLPVGSLQQMNHQHSVWFLYLARLVGRTFFVQVIGPLQNKLHFWLLDLHFLNELGNKQRQRYMNTFHKQIHSKLPLDAFWNPVFSNLGRIWRWRSACVCDCYSGRRLLGALLQLGSGVGRPGRQVVQLTLKLLQLPQQPLDLQLTLRQSLGHLNRDRLGLTIYNCTWESKSGYLCWKTKTTGYKILSHVIWIYWMLSTDRKQVIRYTTVSGDVLLYCIVSLFSDNFTCSSSRLLVISCYHCSLLFLKGYFFQPIM